MHNFSYYWLTFLLGRTKNRILGKKTFVGCRTSGLVTSLTGETQFFFFFRWVPCVTDIYIFAIMPSAICCSMVLSLLELFFNLNTYIFLKMKLKSLTNYSQRHLLCLKSLLFIINNMLCCCHNTGQERLLERRIWLVCINALLLAVM